MQLRSRTDPAVRTSADGRTARWAGHRERRRAEFVDAALHAIAEYGPQTSTEQIANRVGVTRTKLYRYFDGAAELQRSVAQRASEMLTTELEPVWNPIGSPMEMVTTGVSVHVRWLVDHPNLYRYLARHSLTDDDDSVAAIDDVKTTVAANLSALFAAYLTAFGLDTRPAEPLGFGIVGFVESAATRWLDNPAPLSQDEFTAQLAEWVWLLLDKTLKAGGVHLDPHQPLGAPSEVSASASQMQTRREPG
jgi:AcrR family transcriptional regulator